jgi:lipopolysaccharide/colanic/teichoic acid biosynthesis glycosyltransferase
VLTTGFGSEELVDVDLEPWGPLDRVVKRGFDLAFAGVGLLLSIPFVVCIAVAIKLDDGGPVFYEQERTAAFGDTLGVYKFRTMIKGAESASAVISAADAGRPDPRVTRVGGLLRATHLDEIPQLALVLAGTMSVVGPRPERPELDTDMEQDVGEWRRRWFVKPGLTGLSQINDITGHSPREKLRYDIEYIRRQSLWFDAKIVVRQLWIVWVDLLETIEHQ